MHFNGLISKRQGRNAKKKITTLGLFISAMSHVKLIAETRVYICHKNMKSLGIFFYSFSKVFVEKYLKNILKEIKNGLRLRQQQLHFISSLADKTNASRKNKHGTNEQYFCFSLTLKETEIPKLLV